MTEEKEEEKETKKEKGKVELTQVVTETTPAFQLPDGTTVDMQQYLVWLGNQIYEIRQNTG